MSEMDAREALLAAQEALNVWVCTYAADLVTERDVRRAKRTTRKNGGTLAYVAGVNELINAALHPVEQGVSA